MKRVFFSAFVLFSQVSLGVTTDSLLRKYMLSSAFEVEGGNFKPLSPQFTSKLGPNSFSNGTTGWLTFEKTNIKDAEGVWRLTEVMRNLPIGGSVASTSTFRNSELRSVTRCFGIRNKDGSESSRLSCATASRQVCQYVNAFFNKSKDKRTNGIENEISPEILATVNEAQKALGGSSDLALACGAFSKYMAAVNKSVSFSLSDSKEGNWTEMVEADHKAIKDQLDKTGKFPTSSFGFSSVTMMGSKMDDFAKRSESLHDASQDLMAAAVQLELCRNTAEDFGKVGRPGSTGTSGATR